MSTFIDFQKLKQEVPIERVVEMLTLDLKRSGDQLRGHCPIHEGSNPREFVITPAKGLWYCFGGCGGGDQISLYAKVKGISAKDAANEIAGNCTVPRNSTVPGTVPKATRGQQPERRLQPLAYLEASHEALGDLGVSPETLELFGAGYAPKGIMRGRLAIPIHTRAGELVAYCGRSVRAKDQPPLIFPNGFKPWEHIFNANRVREGELYLTRDPLQVLQAFESGVENVVAFLTEDIFAEQLERLAALLDESKCETIGLF